MRNNLYSQQQGFLGDFNGTLITVVSLPLGIWSNLGRQAPPENTTYLSLRYLS